MKDGAFCFHLRATKSINKEKSFSRHFFLWKYQTLIHQLLFEYIPRTGNILFPLASIICTLVKVHIREKHGYVRPYLYKAFYDKLYKCKLRRYDSINYTLKIPEYGNNFGNFIYFPLWIFRLEFTFLKFYLFNSFFSLVGLTIFKILFPLGKCK